MSKKTKQKGASSPEVGVTQSVNDGTSSQQILDQKLPFMGYVLLNLIFWAYCGVQLLVLQLMLRDVPGLFAFFIILAVAFTVVSMYDYVYDRLSGINPESISDNSAASQ